MSLLQHNTPLQEHGRWMDLWTQASSHLSHLDTRDNTALEEWWDWHNQEQDKLSVHTFPVHCGNSIRGSHHASSLHSHDVFHPLTDTCQSKLVAQQMKRSLCTCRLGIHVCLAQSP